MKYSLLFLLTFVLVSCAPKFEVNSSNTSKYADPSKSIVYVGENNTLTNNISDIKLNPVLEKDKSNQEIRKIYLELYSKSNEKYQFGMIKSISISDDANNTILLNSTDFNSAPYVYMNNGKQIKSNDVIETCMFTLDKSQYESIMNSNTIDVKITGVRKNFSILNKDISKTFLVNLKSFYNSYISKTN